MPVPRKKILYLVTEDWFFVSHFLPMAKAARELGFEVAVGTQIGNCGERLHGERMRAIDLGSRRGSLGPVEAVRYFARAYRIVRAEKPDIVHCIALKPVVLGGLAAKLAGARRLVLAPTGLGHLWTVQGAGVRLVRRLVTGVVGRWLDGPHTRFVFENKDDPRALGLDPVAPNVSFVGGAGVAPEEFPFMPEPPAPPVRLAVVSRMIWPKGIATAVAAVQRVQAAGAPVELDLYGEPDPANPLAIPPARLREWSQSPGIRWHGRTADVAQVWREHHISLFLSEYREGLPRTIVEAAAAGRPIVTTDIPGCRDLVRDGREGYLVKPGDIEGAARAIAALAGDAALRQRMGAQANRRFHEGFTEAAVTDTIAAIYRSLVGE